MHKNVIGNYKSIKYELVVMNKVVLIRDLQLFRYNLINQLKNT